MRTWPAVVPLVAAIVAGAAWAQSAPPPAPGSSEARPGFGAGAPSAWACTRRTLLEELPCTVEGTTAAQAPSREAGKEHQRQARLLGEDLCRALARAGEPDEDKGLLGVCTARVATAAKRCGGDGSRRLLDDEGRFNMGHTRCYGALAALVTDMHALAETSGTCCACVADHCGANADRCVEKMAANARPDAPAACLASTCSAECAVLQLAPTRKP